MNPNQPSQYPSNSMPPNRADNAWDFLSAPEPLKPPSLYQKNKKFIWLVGGLLGFMLILLIIAVIASPGSDTNGPQNGSLEGPTTEVPTTIYEGEQLSMSYASSLNINIDEAKEDDGWFINFNDNVDAPSYDLSVDVSFEASPYVDGEDAVREMLEEGQEPSNIVTSEVVMAGFTSQKTVAEFSDEVGQWYLVYATVEAGDRFLTVSGRYQKQLQEITDSFDAMIGSIRLKESSKTVE